MSVVKFAPTPPPPNRSGPETRVSMRWIQVALELRARPGVFGIVRECETRNAASSTAHAIKTGRIKAFRPAGCFDAFAHGCNIWAKYVGESA